jgi:hypothetical protein
VPKIVHGVRNRKEERIRGTEDFEQRLACAIKQIESYRDKLEGGKTYEISRTNNGPLEFKAVEHAKQWLQ